MVYIFVLTPIILGFIYAAIGSVHKLLNEKLSELIESQDRTNQLLEQIGKLAK